MSAQRAWLGFFRRWSGSTAAQAAIYPTETISVGRDESDGSALNAEGLTVLALPGLESGVELQAGENDVFIEAIYATRDVGLALQAPITGAPLPTNPLRIGGARVRGSSVGFAPPPPPWWIGAGWTMLGHLLVPSGVALRAFATTLNTDLTVAFFFREAL